MDSLESDTDSFVILGSSPPPSIIEEKLLCSSMNKTSLSSNATTNFFSKPPISLKNTELSNKNSITSDKSIKSISAIQQQQQELKSMNNSIESIGSATIAQEVILGNLTTNDVNAFSMIDSRYVGKTPDQIIEIQSNFLKMSEEVLKNNNIKLRQQYAKIQKYQNDVTNAAVQSAQEIQKRDEQIQLLKTQLTEIAIKFKVCYQETEKLQSELNNSNRETENLLKEILNLKSENEKLKSHNEKFENQYKLNMSFYENESTELKQELSEKISIIKNQSAEIERLNDLTKNLKTSSISSSLSTVSPPSIDLTSYVSISDFQKQLKEMERENSKLLAENLELKDKEIKFQNEIHAREVYLAEIQERSRTKLDDMDAYNKNLNELKKQNEELKDRIGMLDVMVESHKSDFEMERHQRQTLAGEKETMLTELKSMQRRNQQLTDELKSYGNGRGGGSISSQSSRKSTPPKVAASSPDFVFTSQPSHICPICSNKFNSLISLQIHVETCLTEFD